MAAESAIIAGRVRATEFSESLSTHQGMSSSTEPAVSELLQRARAGDAAARDALFLRCRNYVTVVARSQVESWMRPKIDASDIVQQTLLEAHRGLSGFAGGSEGEWLAWLRQILRHNTQDFIRRCRTEKRGRRA